MEGLKSIPYPLLWSYSCIAYLYGVIWGILDVRLVHSKADAAGVIVECIITLHCTVSVMKGMHNNITWEVEQVRWQLQLEKRKTLSKVNITDVKWLSKISLKSVIFNFEFSTWSQSTSHKLHFAENPIKIGHLVPEMSKCRFWKTMGNKRSCVLWWVISYNQYCRQTTDSAGSYFPSIIAELLNIYYIPLIYPKSQHFASQGVYQHTIFQVWLAIHTIFNSNII